MGVTAYWNCVVWSICVSNSEILRDFVSVPLLNEYMRQDRKREAGEQKHGHAEHRVLIFDGDTCSLVRFVRWRDDKRLLMLQRFHFRFVLDWMVHLPVPSANVSRRGKKISKCWRGANCQFLLECDKNTYTMRNSCYRSYVRQASKSEKKSHASKKAEKLRPEEIPPKRVNARYVVETND
jgi:hypothetical protein